MVESLSQEERDVILYPKGIAKLPTKDTNKASVSPAKTEAEPKDPPQQPKKPQKKKTEDAENEAVGSNTLRRVELYS
jgi:hypothetical protein